MKWLLLSLLMGLTIMARAQKAEFRGVWVDGFNPGIKTKEQVDALLQRVRSANMNAVVVQIRKRGDAYYQSHYEPRATDMAPGFDSLAYLIDRAHHEKPYVEVHAWMNACAVGGNPDPQSITSLHHDWLSLSDKGEDYDKEATKIDPGNPGAEEWTYRVYLDVVRQYDVDAVHFDFIRYGGKNWGYNPVSVERFKTRYGLPADYQPPWYNALWMQWRRDNITNLVRKVYANAMAVNPKAKLSAATICWGNGPQDVADWYHKSSAFGAVWQDWRGWMEEGLLDINIPMAYFQETKYAHFWDNWIKFIEDHRYGHYAAPGAGTWLNTIPETLSQLSETRQPTPAGNIADGICVYSYSGTHKNEPGKTVDEDGFFAAMREGVFQTAASLPKYNWREQPEDGLIKGTLLHADTLAPVDPADVRLWKSHLMLVQRAVDGTGFFAFPHLAPGQYALEIISNGQSVKREITVAAGKVATEDFLIGETNAKKLFSLAKAADGERVLLDHWVVTEDMNGRSGSFKCADSLKSLPIAAALTSDLILPLVKGDIITLIGTASTENGQKTLKDVIVQVVGILPKSGM